ncbi:MAG: hypothetical protein JKX69_06595 [Rhodobacteraceae bacterium]|nr:hypothetical protein [Paracoccaceae bacterium]
MSNFTQRFSKIWRGLRLAAMLPLAAGGAALAEDSIGPQVGRWQAGVICSNQFPDGRIRGNLPFVAQTQVVPALQGYGFGIKT